MYHLRYAAGDEEAPISQTLKAVFENGTFRPLEPPVVSLAEGQHVRLTVETEATPDDVLALAEQVYAGLSEEDIEAIEQIAFDRRAFFSNGP